MDALTLEQLIENPRRGRSSKVSVIVVEIDRAKDPNPIDAPFEFENRVLAKRMPIDEAATLVGSGAQLPYPRPGSRFPWREIQEFYDGGIQLFDFKRQLYDRSFSSSVRDIHEELLNQVLSLSPILPLEIASKIREYALSDMELKDLTAAPAHFPFDVRKETIYIQALGPLKNEEIEVLQARFNEILVKRGARRQ